MNWRSLVARNLWGNLRRYLSYLLSATVAVAVFTMFTVFVENPVVRDGHITQAAGELIRVFRVMVALFAIFFVFYFHAALIRARHKEFGLLLTLGITPRQIGRLIFYESLLMGGLALLAGIGLGVLCSYFFLLAMGALLSLPNALPFAIPASALGATSIFFGAVFLLEAGWIAFRVSLRAPRILLLGARPRQKPPRPSWALALLGLLCVGAAYDLALQFSDSLVQTMVPIVILAIAGTYLLFSQCLVMLLTRLRRPGIPGARLLLISRLSYRLRDYARMLTVVTVLNTVVLCGLAAVFGVLQLAEIEQTLSDPFALQFSVNAVTPAALTPERIEEEIARRRMSVQRALVTPVIETVASADGQTAPVSVMSLSSFKLLHDAIRQAHPEFAVYMRDFPSLTGDDQAYLYVPDAKRPPTFRQVQLLGHGAEFMLQVTYEDNTAILNDWHGGEDIGPSTFAVVVADALYERLAIVAAPADSWRVYSYVLPDWRQSASLVATLRQRIPPDQQSLLTDTITPVNEYKQTLSVTLFGSFFISCLFFLAAGSAIYLKLFSQQEEDRRQFSALQRIGLQRREAARVLSYEFLLLFFIPVALAAIHSGVALANLVNLLHDELAFSAVGRAFAPISLVYIACFAGYFGIARVVYLRKMYPSRESHA